MSASAPPPYVLDVWKIRHITYAASGQAFFAAFYDENSSALDHFTLYWMIGPTTNRTPTTVVTYCTYAAVNDASTQYVNTSNFQHTNKRPTTQYITHTTPLKTRRNQYPITYVNTLAGRSFKKHLSSILRDRQSLLGGWRL